MHDHEEYDDEEDGLEEVVDPAVGEVAPSPFVDDETDAGAVANLTGKALVKEVCRLIRAARAHWDAHHNGAARLARRNAMRLYEKLTAAEREAVPQVLRVWLRYRSEKYYGPRRKSKKK